MEKIKPKAEAKAILIKKKKPKENNDK